MCAYHLFRLSYMFFILNKMMAETESDVLLLLFTIAKVIGTDCRSAVTCCFCDEYVVNSECRNDTCQCRSGFYSNTLGTECIRRKSVFI